MKKEVKKLVDKYQICQICNKKISSHNAILGLVIRPSLVETIKSKFPQWSNEKYICRDELNEFRKDYIEHVIKSEKGELSKLDKEVATSLARHETISKDIGKEFDHTLTFGEKLSDKIAEFGGSWTFIIIFGIVLFTWILVNSLILLWRPYDPYPYILLNLVLSCLAAIQAPVIMMSQNRKEAKDRLRNQNDYKVNMKAELEIRNLNEKIDHLAQNQWQRLLEIQGEQLEILNDINKKRK